MLTLYETESVNMPQVYLLMVMGSREQTMEWKMGEGKFLLGEGKHDMQPLLSEHGYNWKAFLHKL